MGQQYSEADKLAFKKKDYLYARQTAANCAAEVFSGKSVPFAEYKAYSDSIFDWLFQDQDRLPEKKFNSPTEKTDEVDSDVIPKPTPEQARILKLNLDGLGWEIDRKDELCKLVLKYSTDVAGKVDPAYPTTDKAVEPIINHIVKLY